MRQKVAGSIPSKSRRFRMARWRWRLFVVVPVFLIAMFAVIWITLPADPRYNGKPLSVYLYSAHAPSFSANRPVAEVMAAFKTNHENAAAALQSAGPKAMPLLLDWLSSPEQRWEEWMRRQCQKRQLNWLRFTAAPRRLVAMRSIAQIPQHGAPAVPHLIKWLGEGDRQQGQLVMTLGRILESAPNSDQDTMTAHLEPLVETIIRRSEEGMPFRGLVNTLVATYYRRNPPEQREKAIFRLMALPNRDSFESAILVLDPDGTLRNVAMLKMTSPKNSAERAGAAYFFRNYPVMAEKVVPLLIEALGSSNRAVLERSAQALGAYGDASASALPLLSNLVDHPRPIVSTAARNAIAQIHAARQEK